MIFHAISAVLFTFFLYLVGDGFGISKYEYKNREWAYQLSFLIFCGFFLYMDTDLVGKDIGKETSLYYTHGGIILAVLYVFSAIVFLVMTINMYRRPDQIGHHKGIIAIGFVGIAYFLTFPMCVIFGSLISPWTRERIMLISIASIYVLVYIILGVYLTPILNGWCFTYMKGGPDYVSD